MLGIILCGIGLIITITFMIFLLMNAGKTQEELGSAIITLEKILTKKEK